MKHIAALPFAALFTCTLLMSACSTGLIDTAFEREDLVVVHHNEQNDYTLLVYQDPYGQKRHVLRRRGVFEMVLTYLPSGDIRMKERGQQERKISTVEASRVTREINRLINTEGAPQPRSGAVTSTAP
ncbi:MAG: hypothetical protein AAGI71_08505 [Bacteroidota bacterium]